MRNLLCFFEIHSFKYLTRVIEKHDEFETRYCVKRCHRCGRLERLEQPLTTTFKMRVDL